MEQNKKHEHATLPGSKGRAFSLGIIVNSAYTVLELLFGFMIGSMSLVADAVHNLSDVLSLAVAWIAEKLTHRHPTTMRTYGMKGGSILAALINAMLLLVAMGAIIVEAIGRLAHPEPVQAGLVMAVAGIGILINGGTALLFMSGRHGDLNVRGAFLHMAADAGVSLGVVLAGLLMQFTGWTWLDPVMSLVVAFVVLWATWGLLRDAVNMALAAVPRSLDPAQVAEVIRDYPTVRSYHDLHIWSISTTDVALTVHLERTTREGNDAFLDGLTEALRQTCAIDHVTIQIECGNFSTDNQY
ncbi:cation diffusion facilitator family transporter [Lacticaseibacillus sharpeae]|uniref:Co Zn Cd efflux system component n=1 Tax=Lacticaseibacillus sharpeae JCM 1186 = DSM 20505 TaxID=1291052 RepID=A0A0R1ZXP4_9LACO|nr:cation diffusion facilitator family transporter [Lacticaseibacillus sharpeae]KRM55875.1 Co Zn Cd efflux system component [Lacticaseibacillus sharpeae JCM 1186 = DSM 20505]